MKTTHELRELARALRAMRDREMPEPAALVTIIRTQGSTFRRVGAAMLVLADGAVVNALAGGCPHRDLVERAKGVMANRQFGYVGYNEEQGLDLLLEMGCGGTLEVAIEPLVSVDDLAFVPELEAALAMGRPFTLTTVFPSVGSKGSAVRTLGEAGGGSVASSLPQGEVAAATCLIDRDGVATLVEHFAAPLTLVVAGVGEEALQLARLAARLGIRGTLVDANSDALGDLRVPEGWTTVHARPEALALATGMGPNTALVAMTHYLERDIGYLRAGARAGASYLGSLGSRERAALINAAVDAPVLHVPAGLDIGSTTPAEIALAILAEIMACRQHRSGASLSATDGAIHGPLPHRLRPVRAPGNAP